MRILRFVLIAVCVASVPLSSSAQLRPNENGQGWEWHYDGMANNPGLCVMEVERYVVRYRVECTQPGWKTVIWEGLPNPGDYIDTLGANWVKVQAFYAFPQGVQHLLGFGVHVKHAEYPPDWTKAKRLRNTNTIRTQNPDWDFTFTNAGMSFDPCIRPAERSNYRVAQPWGGPRFDSGACKAVEGEWDWYNGGRTHIAGDGKVEGYDAAGKLVGEGTWKCTDPSALRIEILWARGGWRDSLKLSPDGNRLDGENQSKTKIWAVRTRRWQLSDCGAVVGAWTWFNGGTVTLDAQGGVTGYDKDSNRPNPGKWRCVNGSPVTVQIQWVRGGWLDTLVLSQDGQRLDGTNQQKSRVSAVRAPGGR